MDLVALTAVERRIEEVAAPVARSLGLELVRVRIFRGGSPRVQIMADRRDRNIDLDDCESLGRALQEKLGEGVPQLEGHALEVSSPGVNRPLTRERDFEEFAGEEIRLELDEPHEGRRRFRGRLLGLRDGAVALLEESGEVALPEERVARASIVPPPHRFEESLGKDGVS